MPTGFTYPVVDGEVTDLKTFALSCARAFGALISMRDEPNDAPIPDEFKPSDYYHKSLIEAETELAKIKAMSDEECEIAAQSEFTIDCDHYEDRKRKYETEDARCLAMLAKVRLWEPPTPDHDDMKRFMIEQLTMSLHGDVTPYMIKPVLLDGAAWRQKAISLLTERVVYRRDEWAKEQARCTGRTKWLHDLRQSLENV